MSFERFPSLRREKPQCECSWKVKCEQCSVLLVPGRCLLMIFAVSTALDMLEWIRTSYFIPRAASLWPVNSACSRPERGQTVAVLTHICIETAAGSTFQRHKGRQGPNGVRTLSLSLFPLRLYWECLIRRMCRVALGLPLSRSELGSSVGLSFFFPLTRADGSLLNRVKTR